MKGDKKQALENYTKAFEEDTNNQFAHWQVCIMTDQYYKDPQLKLNQYQKFLSAHPELLPFLKERAKKRITELKEELHYAKKSP